MKQNNLNITNTSIFYLAVKFDIVIKKSCSVIVLLLVILSSCDQNQEAPTQYLFGSFDLIVDNEPVHLFPDTMSIRYVRARDSIDGYSYLNLVFGQPDLNVRGNFLNIFQYLYDQEVLEERTVSGDHFDYWFEEESTSGRLKYKQYRSCLDCKANYLEIADLFQIEEVTYVNGSLYVYLYNSDYGNLPGLKARKLHARFDTIPVHIFN
ncbi:MAG: hypothetical protein JXQ90_05495 [Cyclobacteriaceae bacterium]